MTEEEAKHCFLFIEMSYVTQWLQSIQYYVLLSTVAFMLLCLINNKMGDTVLPPCHKTISGLFSNQVCGHCFHCQRWENKRHIHGWVQTTHCLMDLQSPREHWDNCMNTPACLCSFELSSWGRGGERHRGKWLAAEHTADIGWWQIMCIYPFILDDCIVKSRRWKHSPSKMLFRTADAGLMLMNTDKLPLNIWPNWAMIQ